MIKVLMITSRFVYGGIEKLLLELFENKNNPNIQYDLLTLITEKDNVLIERLKAAGVSYYCLELDKHSGFERHIHHYKELYDHVKKNNYNVVHINITSYARALDMLVIKKANVSKRIIHSHSGDEIVPFPWNLLRPIRILYDISATDFFACSDSAAKHLFSKRIYQKKKYTVINNGIEIDRFAFSVRDREKIRSLLGVKNELLIGHVGRLTEAKNHQFLIEVFNEIQLLHPNSKLLLVGDGELRETIVEKINNLELSDKIIMYGSASNVSEMLSAMDIFLFPSKWEGLGMSVIEAQSNGLPCYISENVPQTAVITSNVHQYDTAKGAKWWAERILKDNNCRVSEIQKIKDAGFDIKDTVLQLEKYYSGKE